MKQKQWVRIAAVFFILMILLTIFSRAASSAVKAKVTVLKASGQTIVHEIRLDGMVEAKDHFLQYVPSGLMVKSVRVSTGQQVKKGDVLFTVDVQKLQEKMEEIESEITNTEQRDELSLFRTKKAYQDVKTNANEEKEQAHQVYVKAELEYKSYMDTHKYFIDKENTDQGGTTASVPDDSYYNETKASELKSSLEEAKTTYEMIVREQDKLVKAAQDSVQQTKEDLELEQNSSQLRDSLEKLKPYLQSSGQYVAEYSGVVIRVCVEPGTETAEGVAVMIADASEGVRFRASFAEEDKDDIRKGEFVTLRGINISGEEQSYKISDVIVSKETASEISEFDDSNVYNLIADIPGNLYPVGSSLSAVVSDRSVEYDTCIPIRCLRQKGIDQYFIYVAEDQDTVLGKELVAREMAVTVLDKNEKYAAIEESVTEDVIESVNKDIVDGSRIIIIER